VEGRLPSQAGWRGELHLRMIRSRTDLFNYLLRLCAYDVPTKLIATTPLLTKLKIFLENNVQLILMSEQQLMFHSFHRTFNAQFYTFIIQQYILNIIK